MHGVHFLMEDLCNYPVPAPRVRLEKWNFYKMWLGKVENGYFVQKL